MKYEVLPPHGFVELIQSCADDLDVIRSARISYNNHEQMGHKHIIDIPDAKLIGYLMREKHGSPFEGTFFKFHIKAPIFVLREWFRHRIGSSFNEVSGRYTELKPEFYIPKKSEWRTQVGKPGHYEYQPFDYVNCPGYLPEQEVEDCCKQAFSVYKALLVKGVAKEQARMILPLNTFSEIIWSVNARSLMNFLSLRNADNAQYEIRQYAQKLEDIFSHIMPVTADAFVENGRIAP